MTSQPGNCLVRLVSSLDTVHLSLLEAVLQQQGIDVERRNFMLAVGAGELPFVDVMPELWVAATDQGRAEAILQEFRQVENATESGSRHCPQCNESIELQFAQCWHCGHFFED